ncbi:NHL repeat [Nesidiocoris tenuis]|uniref:peptidylamidoglycolate lyase n=1 Tax=Nesidiocoris tenuis TaxID=355587 RepID=A0ABN7AJT9_9HEMI|nr:NHL repeat [Nesidiocoris tenuis]
MTNNHLSVLVSFSIYASSFVAFSNVERFNQQLTSNQSPDTWNAAKWLSNDLVLGQVGGIAVDKNDTVYIFHRGNHLWTSSSFGQADNVYTEQYNGAINESTIIMVDKNGRVMKKLGEHMFYLPHGITVDSDFNIWVTDVALHQVMKFKPASNDAVLVKGKRFVPGKDSNHFCKPTSVAVLQNGDFFVADGYCNSRIVKFDSNGKKILEWGRSTVRHHGMRIPGPGEFFIPHALALNSDESLLCVADRENGRVQCFHPSNGTYSSLLSKLPFPLRTVYSIAYSNFGGGSFVLVNGPRMFNDLVQGFVVSPSGRWIGSFGSNELNAPHDLAVSADGSAIYVAEITVSGPRAWKFVHKGLTQSGPETTNCKDGDSRKALLPGDGNNEKSTDSLNVNVGEESGLAGAILITSACLVFSIAVIFMGFAYRRSKASVAKDTVSLLPHSEL